MFGRTVPTKDVKLTKLFPNYRKRNVSLRQGTSVCLTGLNWDGGSRSEYTLVDLTTRAMTRIGNNMAAPWDNKDEGSKVTIQPGFAVVETGTFCGKPATMRITFNPADESKITG